MPVLARLRLGSIGCPSARFDPLDLQLVGADQRLRHTLLWLRNGGGKSSLIALTLLMLNPRSVASTLGRKDKGEPKLETDYVLRDQAGVVLAEWLPDHPVPGRPRVHVTFMVMQRGEQDGQADKAFVAATLPAGIDAAELFELHQLRPAAERAGLSAPGRDTILRRARKLQHEHPDWDIWPVAQHEPGKWEERLRSFGLDPGLAQLLARMNLEEGDLAKALTFSGPDEFILQVARLLSPPADVVRDLSRAIGAWASDHRDQAEKRHAQAELGRIRPLWEALALRRTRHLAELDRLKARAVDARALLDGIEAAQVVVTSERDAAEGRLAGARAEHATSRHEVERLAGEAAAVESLHARFEQSRATTQVVATSEQEREARRAHRLARAALPALRIAARERRLEALHQERRASRAESAPIARRRDALARGLADHCAMEAAAARAAEQAAQGEEVRARAALGAEQDALEALQADHAATQRERAALGQRLEAARRARALLQQDGLVGPDEPLGEALERARAAQLAVEAELQAADAARVEAQAAERQASSRAAELRARAEAHAKEKAAAEAALAQAQRACEGLGARASQAQLALPADARLPEAGALALERVAEACRSSGARQFQEAARLAALEETCRSLTERDGLPPARDVARVAGASSGLEPGLEYVRANLASSAADVLGRCPGLAHGVVAATSAALGRARDGLAALDLDLDTPVPIYLASALATATPAGGPAPETILGLAPHVSSDARGLLLERRLEDRERVRRLAKELEARSASLEALRRDLTEGLARHGVEAQGRLREGLELASRRIVEAAQAAADEEERRRAAADRRAAHEADAERLKAERDRARDAERRLGAAAGKHEAALQDGPAQLDGLDARQGELEREVARRRELRDAASRATDRARDERARGLERRRASEQDARRFGGLVVDGATAPAPVTAATRATDEAELEALRARLEDGERALERQAEALRRELEELAHELEQEAGAPDLATLARTSLTPGLDERAARARIEQADAAQSARIAEAGVARAAEKEARERARRTSAAVARLEGEARESAGRLLESTTLEPAALDALRAALPGRRAAADAAVAGAAKVEAAALLAHGEALKLADGWGRLVSLAQDAWEVVTTGPEAEVIVRAAAGIVKDGRNAQVILSPSKQLRALEKDTAAVRRDMQALRREVEAAEREWLEAAHTARAGAEASTATWVRSFVALRLQPTAVEPGVRARLLGQRAHEDLVLVDRELEDLAAQLADIVQTQRTLAQQLAQQALDLAHRIQGLERASTLPEGLGRWSNEQFLKVDLPIVKDLAELTPLLERALGEWVDGDRMPTQRDLIAEALGRGLVGRPHVTMPKADRFDRFRRRPIQQLGKDSGGEALTAAFILFCVLARVVTSGRTEQRVALALVDNPLGTANRFDFVEAQCRVAAAFGVQYVAASGITDVAAVERFERTITLTNPGQARVVVSGVEDNDVGRPIQSVSAAREDVLGPPGAPPRTWARERP